MTHLLRSITAVVLTLAVGLPALWGAFALWFQLPGGQVIKTCGMLVWIGFSIAVLIGLWQGRTALGLLVFILAFAGLLLWWRQLAPTDKRVWAEDVSRITTGTVAANLVTLHDVRNFDWRSTTDFTPRWETRSYDLQRLNSVDLIMSYWSGPAIAHMLISFGFDDGQHVAFSVEVRREQRESFSELGGFFKAFELSIIAADERDIIRVRTNIRGEDDYLYHLRIPYSAMRSLFLSYVDEANRLKQKPRFYNTITVNCTTLVYHMMKRIVGYLPWNYRLLLVGYLPEYVYGVEGLDLRYSLAELKAMGRITERAKQADRSDDFSVAIREGIPALRPEDLPKGDLATATRKP
jgi:Domain of unknown function (DUF4105)